MVMGICGLLVVLGLVAVAVWGGGDVEAPAGGEPLPPDEPPPPGMVARRYLWSVTVAAVAGLGAALLLAGPGGRLAMRLLAATAGDAAQGRETEAEEIVGRITVGGTIGFVVFTALFFGLATGALYLLVRRWLPRGRAGGLAFGALLLVVAATRIEPLRLDNPDFDIVGPGWVAVLAFGALVLAHGMAVAALAARYGRALPLLSGPRSLIGYAPLLLLLPAAPFLVLLALVGMVTVAASRIEPLVRGLRSGRAVLAGRLVLGAAALVALPGFVSAIADIAAKSP